MAFQRAASLDELWSGEAVGVTVEGQNVLLVNHEGTVRAYEDRCRHRSVRLSGGKLDGTTLVCPAHGWSYDVRTGAGVNPEHTQLTTFPVRVEGGLVLVDVHASVPGHGPDQGARQVGPVLEPGEVAGHVLRAILALNPEASVVDRGGYIRVLAPRRCRVTRAAIEAETRAPFRLPGDLEAIMPSFKGCFRVDEDEAVWEIGGSR